MKHLTYQNYKPSGVEWLGEIPSHWEMSRLKHIARFTTGWTPPTSQDEYYFGENPWVTIADLGPRLLSDPKGRISDDAIASSRLIISPKGSLLFSFKLSIGQVSIAERDLYTNEAIATFPPDNGTDVGYLYWAAPLFIPMNADENIYGAKLLGQETIKNATFAAPPSLSEQRAIAAFLDRETARIDALIEKKQRQIELLQEKRAALISHTVTKGLDPNARMKDSGIEWLDRIPGHWKIRCLRYLGNCQNGINIGSEYFGTGHPFVSYGDVFSNRELPHNVDGLVRSSAIDRERYSVRVGDVFFTRTSETVEEIGYSSVCLNSIDDAVFAGFLIRFRPSGRDLNVAFSKFYFQNIFLRAFFVKEMNLVTRASLSQDLLKQMSVLIPPLEEQAQIASFLDRETGRINSLIEKIENSIGLLREYRTALVSAAVTGKIDVGERQ